MIQRRLPWDRTGQPHARIELPRLSGHEALLIFDILEMVLDAIWEAHENEMLEIIVDSMEEETDYQQHNPRWTESTEQVDELKQSGDADKQPPS